MNFLRNLFGGNKRDDEEAERRRGRRTPRMVMLYNPADCATHLSKKKPFFRMKSGGTYAVATTKEGIATHFIRVDKDRRPVKLRKRERREIRMYQQQSIAQIGK